MRYVNWTRIRAGRLFAVMLALLVYFLLLTVDALRFFPHTATHSSSLLWPGVNFGLSALFALMFLAVGTLVWLYARSRRVALLLFCFSLTMMVTFAVLTGAGSNDPLLSAISDAGIALSLSLFAILLLFFPKNYLSVHLPSREASLFNGILSRRRYYALLLLRGYLLVVLLFGTLVASHSVAHYLLPFRLPGWLDPIDYGYYLFVLVGILITIAISYRQSSSLRQRQQQRLFVGGVILAFAPALVLTVLPNVLNLPQYVINGQYSALTLGLLPLALGYTILRYQVLVFDMYVRRAVAWLVGGVSLAVLGYLLLVLPGAFLSGVAYAVCIIFFMALLGPCTWWLAHVVTERLFFSENVHYRRLIENPDLMSNKTLDLDETSQLLTVAAVNVFETQEVCLFVLDEDTGCYRPYPTLKTDDAKDESRRSLGQRLLSAVKSSVQGSTDWLEGTSLLIKHIADAPRPLLLSEAQRAEENMPSGLARYLATAPVDSSEPLLAPMWAQGKMIGVLVLGERGDRQQYAGPDFEAIDLILSRFSSVVETARLYERASRNVAILNTLYGATAMPVEAFETVEDVAIAYTKVAAEAVRAGAEMWLYHENDHLLHRVVHEGEGPQLISQEHLTPSQASDWTFWFYQGESSQVWNGTSSDGPPCLSLDAAMLRFPFAWIPLKRGQQYLGILALTYPRPHLFSHEEKRVLAMFASQSAVALENAKITIELRAAYERQKELDRLKDQFIITASHELRTPLTAVQGYIELLAEYNATLQPEAQADFIAKASRGCDELTLLVGNIMDASRVQIDAEHISLDSVPLAESVYHVMEILEAVTRREHRPIQVDVPADALVLADNLRLRQVLLNLVSNALKYSPAGSGIEVTVEMDDEQVVLCIRDHGLGVPLEDQERLFERFVRLERDMNSPVRGAGLGLYISKQLIEAMGGHIEVESTGIPGEGSIFAFTLKRPRLDKLRQGFMLEHQEAKSRLS